MFESNYPVDFATARYPVIWNAFKRIASGASTDEKAALFGRTAARLYRIDLPLKTRSKWSKTMALAQDLRERLTLPAFAAPMFLCSGVELATECCKAGIIGSLTRNHCRDLAELEAQLKAVSEALARIADEHPGRKIGPLAVNISPTFGMDEMKAHLRGLQPLWSAHHRDLGRRPHRERAAHPGCGHAAFPRRDHDPLCRKGGEGRR